MDLVALAMLAAVPPVFLSAAALAAAGLSDPVVYEGAVTLMDWRRAGPVLLAATAGRVWMAFCSIAVFVLLERKREGEACSLRRSLAGAADLFWPFAMTGLRATLYIAGGTLLLVVPGIVLAIRYLLAHLAVVVEGMRGPAALSRSRQLMGFNTAGALGRFLCAALAAAAASVLVTIGVDIFAAACEVVVGTAPGLVERQLLAALSETGWGLCAAWFSACSLLLYHDLESLAPPPAQRS